MKTKISIILEDDVVQKLKDRAIKKRKPISKIIDDALSWYLTSGSIQREIRQSAVAHLCSRPFKLSANEMREIMESDYYEQ